MDKEFWKKVLKIGIPVAIQNLVNTLVNMIDTFMIGSVGENYVSAIGLANKVFFVLSLICFGITSGCSVLMSQYYGKKDYENLNKSFGVAEILALSISFIFFIVSISIPQHLMKLFTESELLIEIGSPYLRIVGTSFIISAFSMAAAGLFRSTNKTKIPMFITILSVFTNCFFNYMFIFGNFGAPRLLASGAAIATVIARVVEFVLMVAYLIVSKSSLHFSIKSALSINKTIFFKNIKYAYPVIINESAWGLGTTMYSVIYGHMSDNVVAATTIATSLQDLVYALLFGISTACAVIVGNYLGANKLDKAKKAGGTLLITGVITSLFMAALLVVLTKPYIKIFDPSDTVASYIMIICIIYAFVMPLKTFNLINIVGVLRSGGDTLFCMILEAAALWCVGIPIGFISAFAFNLDIKYVYMLIMSEEVVKVIAGSIRYKQYKWVKNITI